MIHIINAIITVAWISATVYLISTEHNYWAVATFIAALCDYFYIKPKNTVPAGKPVN